MSMDFQAEVTSWRHEHQQKLPEHLSPVNQLLHQSCDNSLPLTVATGVAASPVLVCARLRPILHQAKLIGHPIPSLARSSSSQVIHEFESMSSCQLSSDSADLLDEELHKSLVFVHQEESYVGELSGQLQTSCYQLHRMFAAPASTTEIYAEVIEPMLRRVLVGQQCRHQNQRQQEEEEREETAVSTPVPSALHPEAHPAAPLHRHDTSPSTALPPVWCISFGMTGSGKTHTSQETFLLAARCLLGARKRCHCGLAVSMAEIRGNECYDLLDYEARSASGIEKTCRRVSLREDGQGRVHLAASQWRLQGEEDLLRSVGAFCEHRATAATGLNEHSSRSHAVLTLSFTAVGAGEEEEEEGEGGRESSGMFWHGLQRCAASVRVHTRAVCRILDLAGSERQR
jgi:hypothetical protein